MKIHKTKYIKSSSPVIKDKKIVGYVRRTRIESSKVGQSSVFLSLSLSLRRSFLLVLETVLLRYLAMHESCPMEAQGKSGGWVNIPKERFS